jgi:hypothetical protein
MLQERYRRESWTQRQVATKADNGAHPATVLYRERT